MIRVTFDTNVVPVNDTQRSTLLLTLKNKHVEVRVITVTEREMKNYSPSISLKPLIETGVWGESDWGNALYGEKPLLEIFVFGESALGSAVLAASEDPLEVILSLISNRSFPPRGKRDSLSKGQRRQLRDAMIFQAHIRERRDIFVSDDARAFGRYGDNKRKGLENTFQTKIMSLLEFFQYLAKLPN